MYGRTLFLALIFFNGSILPVQARDVILQWDANTGGDVRYRVYYNIDSPGPPFAGMGAVQGSSPVDVGDQAMVVLNGLDANRVYFFAVTAYNASGKESGYSNIVSTGSAAIPKGGWKLKYVDSQELVAQNGGAVNAFDADAGTLWVTQWSGAAPLPPHEIQIDLGATYNLTGFSYLPRQGGSLKGSIAGYDFYVSNDGERWGAPAASGRFEASSSEKKVGFSSVRQGRYVRLRALSEINGSPWTSLAELSVFGDSLPVMDTAAPTVSIDSPASGASVTGTVPVSVSAADNTGVVRVELYLDHVLQGADTVPPFTFSWASSRSATGGHTLTAKVYDAVGNVGESGAVPVVVELPVAEFPIPKTGWRLAYVDSQEVTGENGAARNAFDGNPFTNWVTEWSARTVFPPHEIRIDLGQTYSIGSFSYLPRQGGSMKGTIAAYEFYVSDDGIAWGTAVATGIFSKSLEEKKVSFNAKRGRYVRLRALSEVNGDPWTAIAEVSVFGGMYRP